MQEHLSIADIVRPRHSPDPEGTFNGVDIDIVSTPVHHIVRDTIAFIQVH